MWRLLFALALFGYGSLQIYANITSGIADDARAGRESVPWQLWSTEISSGISWFVVSALLWWLFTKVGPPRFKWPSLIGVYAVAAIATSALHVALMVALREIVWWSHGLDYKFGGMLTAWPYEFRKDLAIFVILFASFALLEWFLVRPHQNRSSSPQVILAISDGPRTFQVPANEIDSIEAAGNYVEVQQGERTLLHRATMQTMEDTLVPSGFVRIHRSVLVRRAAIRMIDVAQSGDFKVELESGKIVRGSRRYRSALD
jgi:hypothetical protein